MRRALASSPCAATGCPLTIYMLPQLIMWGDQERKGNEANTLLAQAPRRRSKQEA